MDLEIDTSNCTCIDQGSCIPIPLAFAIIFFVTICTHLVTCIGCNIKKDGKTGRLNTRLTMTEKKINKLEGILAFKDPAVRSCSITTLSQCSPSIVIKNHTSLDVAYETRLTSTSTLQSNESCNALNEYVSSKYNDGSSSDTAVPQTTRPIDVSVDVHCVRGHSTEAVNSIDTKLNEEASSFSSLSMHTCLNEPFSLINQFKIIENEEQEKWV